VKLETRDQNLKVGGGLNFIFSILSESVPKGVS
jgi:hypothetical protein